MNVVRQSLNDKVYEQVKFLVEKKSADVTVVDKYGHNIVSLTGEYRHTR